MGIKYINYGEEQEFCASMRADPSGDLGDLISYKYDENFQCQDSRSRSMIFSIPAVTRRRNESIPEGTPDLSQLMQGKSVLFRIPDKQWLVEHGWIGEDEIGPVFVKQLDLYPLPEMSNDVVVNSATFILINNTLNEEEIVFDRRLSATFSRQENFVDCFNPPELPSPYNVANCDKYKTARRTATGTFGSGNIYPSLVGSLWSVKFDLPSKPAMPYPKTPFFLKVYATICNVKNAVEKGDDVEEGVCCSAGGDDQYQTNSGCDVCPPGSKSRLRGFYCESCPPGHESASATSASKSTILELASSDDVRAFGCSPCAVDFYKEKEGSDSACLPCTPGQFTNGTLGSTVCINRD